MTNYLTGTVTGQSGDGNFSGYKRGTALPALPDPAKNIDSIHETVLQIKQAVELLQGTRGSGNSTVATTAQINDIGGVVNANASSLQTAQGNITTAQGNISTLQGQMTTANSNIATLQSQVNNLHGQFLGTTTVNVAGSSTVTIPTGATQGFVRLWGGQAGIHTSSTFLSGGGGGYLEKLLTGLVATKTLNLTVGVLGTSSGTPTPGGASSLSSGTQSISTLTANGGAIFSGTAAGVGGTATGGDLNITGMPGTVAAGDPSGVTGGGFTGPGGCVIEWYS